jgi:type VI secretion system protein ImpB
MASMQKKLDRVRRPRVQITYDVETNGAMQKTELPFVVGVIADLSGSPKEKLRPMKDRKFVNIDRDNFDTVLERSTPRVAFKVDNKLTDDDTKLGVELNFKNMGDFDPAKVAMQVPALRELLEMRHRLDQLLSKMEGNDKLEEMLTQIMGDSEQAQKMAQELGITESKES